MTYITIKTKKIKAKVEIFPPIVLDGRSHISLVEIRIPEEETKSFTFTNKQVISTGLNDSEPKMTIFPKGEYNIYKLRYDIKKSPLVEHIDLNIETTNNNIYITTKNDTIRVSSELAQILNIPEIIMPFSSIKISGDEKYLINCNLVENRSSYSWCPSISISFIKSLSI